MATFYTTSGTTYTLSSSIGSTDTSINLSSFYEPISNAPYTMSLINSSIVYGTIAPQSTQSELVSFTGITQNADGTATLTGVVRGLGRSYPYASSSTFKLPHAGQSIFILSDAPEVFAKYPAKDNAETVPGDWTFTGNTTFTNFPVTPSNSDASTTVKGITKLSTAPASPTNPIAVGTNDPRIPTANPNTLYVPLTVGTPVIQKFTASGTYTPTAGLKYAIVELVGGGGSGAGALTAGTNGSGGSAGGYARKIVLAAAIGASQAVTIGAGASAGTAGNNPGNAGNATSFGAIFSATGGGRGNYNAGADAPGTGVSGDLNLSGYAGTIGSGNPGGASYFGSTYGIGGSGASGNGVSQSGQPGVSGLLMVTEYFI